MRTVLFNGPFISEIDAGYNVQANGVSINFLKNPFCFKSGFLSSINDLNYTSDKVDSLSNLGKHVKVLKPLKVIEYVEVPKYLYEERIVDKIEVVNKNVYVPYDGPVFRTKEVKVPVYKEKIKYVPVHVEREKIYEIPKLKIHDLIQENLLYLHKNHIEYKDLNHVVERVIPTLNKKVVEKIIKPPVIDMKDISQRTQSTSVSSHSSSSSENGHIEPEVLDHEDKNDYADISSHDADRLSHDVDLLSHDTDPLSHDADLLSHQAAHQVLVETEGTPPHSPIQDTIIAEEEVTNIHEKNAQDNNSVTHPMGSKKEQKHLTEKMDKIEEKSAEKKIETRGNRGMGKYAALPSLNLSALIEKKERNTSDANSSNEDGVKLSENCNVSKKSSIDSFVKMVCSRDHSYGSSSSVTSIY